MWKDHLNWWMDKIYNHFFYTYNTIPSKIQQDILTDQEQHHLSSECSLWYIRDLLTLTLQLMWPDLWFDLITLMTAIPGIYTPTMKYKFKLFSRRWCVCWGRGEGGAGGGCTHVHLPITMYIAIPLYASLTPTHTNKV